jgi:hypothetical protein
VDVVEAKVKEARSTRLSHPTPKKTEKIKEKNGKKRKHRHRPE